MNRRKGETFSAAENENWVAMETKATTTASDINQFSFGLID